jgi:hypothetical protein
VDVDDEEEDMYDGWQHAPDAEANDREEDDPDAETSSEKSNDSDHSYDSNRQYPIPSEKSFNLAGFEMEPLSVFAVGTTPNKGLPLPPALLRHLYLGISKTKGGKQREKGLTVEQRDGYERLILNRATGDVRSVPENNSQQEDDFAMSKTFLLRSVRDMVKEFAAEVFQARKFIEDLWRQRDEQMRKSADLHHEAKDPPGCRER